MPLINKNVLLGIADRAASQMKMISMAFDSINFTSVTAQYYWQRITATDDPDVEIPLLSTYYNTDYNTTEAAFVRGGGSTLLQIVSTMDQHFSRMSQTGSWDGYLTSKDARISDYFNQLYKYAKGQFMLANNTFSECEDVFGIAERIAGPAIDYTDGIDYGDGSTTNKADGTHFAASQMKAVVDTGVTIGGANLDLVLAVKDKNNNPTTINVTIPSGSGPGTEVDIGTSTDRFLDLTGVTLGPTTGTNGDKVRIENKKERSIHM